MRDQAHDTKMSCSVRKDSKVLILYVVAITTLIMICQFLYSLYEMNKNILTKFYVINLPLKMSIISGCHNMQGCRQGGGGPSQKMRLIFFFFFSFLVNCI